VASFYSCALRRSNAGLREEGEREVTARCCSTRVRDKGQLGAAQRWSTHARRKLQRGCQRQRTRVRATPSGVCPYAALQDALARGWHETWPRGKRAYAITPCLRGARLGSWRARWDASSASKGGGSRGDARNIIAGAWPRQCGECSSSVLRHAIAAQRRTATRRDGSARNQRPTARGCDGAA
jgi:hypothetical protein